MSGLTTVKHKYFADKNNLFLKCSCNLIFTHGDSIVPVKNFYVHMFVYCVMIMAVIVSTEMSCVIRGYHVYKTVWTAILGEELECRREVNNSVDRYAVGVYKLDGTLVGHLPQRLTTLVLLFLR